LIQKNVVRHQKADFFNTLLGFVPLMGRLFVRRVMLTLTASFAVSLLLWLVGNHIMYGLWAGPHLAGNAGHSLRPEDHVATGNALALSQLPLRAMLQLTGGGPESNRAVLLLMLLGAIPLASRAGDAARYAVPLLYVAGCILSALLLRCAVPSSGLFQVTPLLLPVLALPLLRTVTSLRAVPSLRTAPVTASASATPPKPSAIPPKPSAIPPNPSEPELWGPDTSDKEPLVMSVFYAWMGRVCGIFILLVLLSPVLPGMDWGSRYLLTVLPLLALLAARVLEGQYRAEKLQSYETQPQKFAQAQKVNQAQALGGARSFAFVVIGMLGLSIACQCCGLAAVRNDLAYSRELNRAAAAAAPATLVTDLYWLGPELTTSTRKTASTRTGPVPRPTQFLVRSEDDRRLLLSRLPRDTAGFTFMGTDAGLLDLTHDATHRAAAFHQVKAWHGAGLQLAHFAPQPPAPPRTKHVMALYYPWYGTPERTGRWSHQDGVNTQNKTILDHTHYPAIGPYDSTDPAVIERHLTEAKAAGIDTLVCSWWGQKDLTDDATRLLLRGAAAHSIKVCVFWERLSAPDDPKAALADLSYLLGTLAKNPSYLREGGKPVIFLGGGVSQGLSLDAWASVASQASAQTPPGVQLIGIGQSPSDVLLCDGFYTFSTIRPIAGASIEDAVRIQGESFRPVIRLAKDAGGVSVESIAPGFDDRRADRGALVGTLSDRQNGKLYSAMWRQAIKDNPDWVLINSFNAWQNGTEIEPSVELGDKYLTLTRQFSDQFRSGVRPPP